MVRVPLTSQDRSSVFAFVFDFFTRLRRVFTLKRTFPVSQQLLNPDSRPKVALPSYFHGRDSMHELNESLELYQYDFIHDPKPSFEPLDFRSGHCFHCSDVQYF